MSTIILFEENQVRRAWNQTESKWYFSIDDVVSVLTGSANVKDYIKKLRKRDPALDAYWETNCPLVAMPGADGKIRPIRAANAEGLFRIIQSIPSPRAEPFKLWLARVGHERLEEIENPELAAQRMREIYRQKGYSAHWIEKRMRGIALRDELTDEWKKRGVKEQRDFAILTAEISQATFGMTPSEYKDFQALASPKDNLRDHMTDLELIFTMLGEDSATGDRAQKRRPRIPPRTSKSPKPAAASPATPGANLGTGGNDGRLEFTNNVMPHLVDIELRVLAGGAHAEGLAPVTLGESVATAAAEMCRRYHPEKIWTFYSPGQRMSHPARYCRRRRFNPATAPTITTRL